MDDGLFVGCGSTREADISATKGTRRYSDVSYHPDDVLMFGPETRGLPDKVLAEFTTDNILRVPMLPDSRSINLSNTVSIFIYEAWRQNNFGGAN